MTEWGKYTPKVEYVVPFIHVTVWLSSRWAKSRGVNLRSWTSFPPTHSRLYGNRDEVFRDWQGLKYVELA